SAHSFSSAVSSLSALSFISYSFVEFPSAQAVSKPTTTMSEPAMRNTDADIFMAQLHEASPRRGAPAESPDATLRFCRGRRPAFGGGANWNTCRRAYEPPCLSAGG